MKFSFEVQGTQFVTVNSEGLLSTVTFFNEDSRESFEFFGCIERIQEILERLTDMHALSVETQNIVELVLEPGKEPIISAFENNELDSEYEPGSLKLPAPVVEGTSVSKTKKHKLRTKSTPPRTRK